MNSNLSIVYKVQQDSELATLKQSLQAAPERAETVVVVHDSVQSPDIDADRVVSTHLDSLTIGRNVGAAEATNPYIAFMDADAVPGPLWGDRIMQGFTRADMVGGPLHPLQPQHLPSALPQSFHWLVGCGPYYDEPQPVPNTYGSNFAVRRKAFEAVNGFRTDIGMGSGGVNQGAETDLARRVRQAGFDGVWYDPDAVVYHTISPNLDWRGLLTRAYNQGRAKAKIGVGDRESGFIRDELFRHDGTVVSWGAKTVLTGCVGAGYVQQRVMK